MDKKDWVNFKALKQSVTMERLLDHYGLLGTLRRKRQDLMGVCPIHKGSNPSQFHVSLTKNNFYCFGNCKSGGNIFDFVMQMEGVPLREAGLLLQRWFDLPPAGATPAKVPDQAERKVPDPVEEDRTNVNTPLSFTLRSLDPSHPYLIERGLKEDTIKEFGLGYAKRGLMAGRIAIPIHNPLGDLIAYAGRWPGDPPEGEDRYKLPPGFRKMLVLFNLHRAIQSPQFTERRELILVEGFFGCMKIYQSGIRNVVALMGSSLSEEQEALLIEEADRIRLLLDRDEAGEKGGEELLPRLARSLFVRVVDLPENVRQPDELAEGDLLSLFT